MGEKLSKSFPNAKFIPIPYANHQIFGFLNETHWRQMDNFIR
ncbi:hypothetical protein LEP1GSC193_3637 [Leptospira alstonii serovar Pingchang str. 80-412]|uniref:Alpha/beta hydrolase domain protein n=2 Tax=Leptospira alstonii TaxID=28452 RepID=M6CSG6_9LEPT|nr:hypothetical protein LEP1GSC194_0772 [Leptospira alstonii serovar Sichuan str. 79601]EQA81267.1 hypothetical protein LEP1GSC193_3637 [Leptospira alstonii serovar Pingchang str. 80-412]